MGPLGATWPDPGVPGPSLDGLLVHLGPILVASGVFFVDFLLFLALQSLEISCSPRNKNAPNQYILQAFQRKQPLEQSITGTVAGTALCAIGLRIYMMTRL